MQWRRNPPNTASEGNVHAMQLALQRTSMGRELTGFDDGLSAVDLASLQALAELRSQARGTHVPNNKITETMKNNSSYMGNRRRAGLRFCV